MSSNITFNTEFTLEEMGLLVGHLVCKLLDGTATEAEKMLCEKFEISVG